MASDNASCNEDADDVELVRKRKQLQFIEEEIARKRAFIALKKNELQQPPPLRPKNELQRTTTYREKHDEYRGSEWNTRREMEPNRPSRLQYQESGRLTERQPSNTGHSAEGRNAEFLHRDVKKKRRTELDYNPTFTPEHKVKASRPHCHSEHARSSPVSKSSAEESDHFHHTPGTSNRSPPSKGFDRFLSILNQGIDLGRLSDIVNAPQDGAVDNKGMADFHDETHRCVNWDPDDSRDKERASGGIRAETSVRKSHSRDKEKEHRGNLRNSEERHRGSSGRRSDRRRDKCRHSDEEKNSDWRERERDRGWDSRHGSWKSRERDRSWNSREGDRDRDSREKDGSWKSRERERSWNSREGDRSWKSREGDRDWGSKEGDWSWNSREGDTSLNSRDEERTWNSSEGDRDSRHGRLESRKSQWDQKNSTSKTEDWDKKWRNADREHRHLEHHRDSLSPSRRSSQHISSSTRAQSRSSSPILSSSEDKRTTEKREQFSNIQSLFQTVGLDLGLDELDRLSSRTQERLYGVRNPRDGTQVERRQQRQHWDSSQSSILDGRSPDSLYRRQDSRRHRGDAEHPQRDSETQSIDFFAPGSSAVQNIPTLSQPPPATYSSYAMTHTTSEGQHHSATVQSLTTGWSGVAHSPYDPQYPPPPTLSTPTTSQPLIHLPTYSLLPTPLTHLTPPPIHPSLQQTLLCPPLLNLQSLSNLTPPLSTGSFLPSFPPPGSRVTAVPSVAVTHTTSTNETSRCLKALKEVPLLPLKKQDNSVLLTLSSHQRKRAKEKRKRALIEGPRSVADIAKIMYWKITKKTNRIAAKARAKAAAAAAAAAALAPPVANTRTVAPPVLYDAAPAAELPKPDKPVIVLRLKSGEIVGPTRPAVKAGDKAGKNVNVA